MTTSKRMTSKNGITIPKHVRADAGFYPGMAVDIETIPDGVIIRKHVPTCRQCGAVEQVVRLGGMEYCRACAAKLKKEMEAYGI